ncbi:hypothetical protein PPYR_01889 [Photinus pyralis]|uniref:Uncharacterized protein n=1 Tax=Photinus pyralis TaxID=7054 RepID=A0A5N4B5N9_PHOPY|nr:ejaculatory bulb-specific protein 3-like [Photinus pyralis]KAB0804919.1 hypothetical protein PPYR_01889 [Photinus pyralis]
MNNSVILLFLVALLRATSGDTIADEFDNIDIDEILSSKRLVDNYIHCFKTGQKCTPDGQKFRDVLPKAMKSKCEDCSPAQREKVFKVVEWAAQNRPDDFLELENIYDSQHEYRREFEAELKQRNIALPPLRN